MKLGRWRGRPSGLDCRHSSGKSVWVKVSGGKEEGVPHISACVFIFPWLTQCFSLQCGQFTIVSEYFFPSGNRGMWETFSSVSRGKYRRCENVSPVVCRISSSVCLYERKQSSNGPAWPGSDPLWLVVCAGGRSATCRYAVPGWAPGPQAPSAGQWAGQRGALAPPLPTAPQASSAAPHGGRWDCSHRAGLASFSTHR